mgnify:CR=1 FL=1
MQTLLRILRGRVFASDGLLVSSRHIQGLRDIYSEKRFSSPHCVFLRPSGCVPGGLLLLAFGTILFSQVNSSPNIGELHAEEIPKSDEL